VIEERAVQLVERLRARNVLAHVARSGVYQFGIRVVLPGGREAVWDNDGTAALEAQVLQDGGLVGFVPTVPGSQDFDDDAVVEAADGVRVLVDPKSVPIVRGSTLEHNDALLGGGLKMINPQATHECACGDSFAI